MSEPIFLGCTTPEQDDRLLKSILAVRERQELIAALQAADAVMTATDSRLDLGNQLGDGPMQVWVDAHRQVRAALEKARGQ